MKVIKWFLAVLTVIPTVIMLGILPDTVPVHFDINGIPDRYGSKFELLMLPMIAIASIIMFNFISGVYKKQIESATDDKKKNELISNSKVLNIVMLIMPTVMCVLNIVFLYNTYAMVNKDAGFPEIDTMNVVGAIMGLTFIVFGNYMPKTKNNRYIGFRFPWTMYNDTTWNKSNRFASYAMITAGVITIISALLTKGIVSSIIMISSLVIVIPIILIYAYFVYRAERRKESEGEFKK